MIQITEGKFVTVLDQRRANNILIEIKRFPAARHIKAAILSMDYSYFNKEIVEVRVSFFSHRKGGERLLPDCLSCSDVREEILKTLDQFDDS